MLISSQIELCCSLSTIGESNGVRDPPLKIALPVPGSSDSVARVPSHSGGRRPVLLSDSRCPVGDLGGRLGRMGVLSILSLSPSCPILVRISCTIELVCAADAAVALDSFAEAAVESAILSILAV